MTIVVVGFVVGFLAAQWGYVVATYRLDGTVIACLIAMAIAALVARAAMHASLFGELGVGAAFADWFRLVAVSSFAGYLPVGAGLVAKGVYLKRVYAMPFSTFAVGQVVLLVMILGTNGLVGLAALLPRPMSGATLAFAIAFAIMIVGCALLWAPARWANYLFRRSWGFSESSLVRLRARLRSVGLYQIAVLVAMAWSLQLAFSLGGVEATIFTCLTLSAAAALARLVTVTPGAIGVRELIIGALAQTVGVEFRDAVVAASIVRAVEVATIVPLGAYYTYGVAGRALRTSR